MSAEEYLRGLLRKYAVNTKGAEAAGNKIYPVLEKWSNGFLNKAEFSGSLAKGTGISLSTDADIFLSLSSTTPGTLSDMYETLSKAVSIAGYPVRKQDVSVGTTVDGYSIDLVPGRRQSQYGNEHSLYRNRTGSWTKTDVQTHITLVSGSGRTEEIRILKIWRTLRNLRFPSFYLELAVLAALRYARQGDIAANVWRTLQYLHDNIKTARFIDPANTNNVVSDDCSASEKAAICLQAGASIGKKTWDEIVW
ncbi:nucleotidyltransferase [Denitromonas halophila]|uniref:Nucleotidyltransferase n=1 Tax=Denitromonas halophila TaxID=1629404 RepID=A0A557R2V1_9RHOO|nr:nucleotidyltransferase [Denitromonas halophila]TVO59456.1 nucleotidyltransferase [Denitromonas halophila]